MKRALKLIYLLLVSAALLTGCRQQATKNESAETSAAAEAVITTPPASTASALAAPAETTAAETTVAETTAAETTAAGTVPAAEKEAVTILYTNDIHSYIYNTAKDKDGNEAPALRLSGVAAYRDKLVAEGKNVILVDSGDVIQGNVYGSYDQGETVLRLMQSAGYQAAAVGNHEFDYSVERLVELTRKLSYPFLSCSFRDEKGEKVFEDTKIIESGGVKIGFVGVTTPATLTTSTPTFFQNDAGEYIYSFDGISDPQELYASVQEAVDSIRDEVDYVIVLGHLGCGQDEKKVGISSYDVIANTTGIDAVLDGHSHTTLEMDLPKNKDGKEVLLAQTGSYLGALGQLEISADGRLESYLITEVPEERDELIAEAEDAYHASIMEAMGQKTAVLETNLYICDAENEKRRLVRARETNMGDFASDSVYWFFNEEKQLPCDIVLTNGGGLRTSLKAGDISMLDIKTVRPFDNQICMIRATGQQVLDALEMGCKLTGEWDNDWDCPAEYGGFMQVAGIKYTIDAAIPSGVRLDENGMFAGVDGERRVSDVEVYNRQTGKYEPLEADRTYTVGSINYLLRSCGDGFSMFKDTQAVVDYVGTDNSVMMDYVQAFTKKDGYPSVSTENSPLKSYTGYQLDYEDPTGAGRITFLNLE